MTRKILALISALLIAASLVACNNNEEETTTDGEQINIEETSGENTTGGSEQCSEIESNTNSTASTIPADYEYVAKSDTVYVLHPNGAVNLRKADGTVYTNVKNGTALTRVKISSDSDATFSKIDFTNEKGEVVELYIYTYCVIENADIDAGFVAVEKTLTKGEGSLSIRFDPSMTHEAIGYLYEGNSVKVIAENTTTGWYKIEFVAYGGETMVGYVASDAKYFVETSTTAEATTEATTEAPTEAGTEASTESAGK